MSAHYVHIVRRDSDVDTGYGPYSDLTEARLCRAELTEKLDRHEWFDGCYASTIEPSDGLYPVSAS